jgi:hypothetical protein
MERRLNDIGRETRVIRLKACVSSASSTKIPTLAEYNIHGTKDTMISSHPSDYLELVRTVCSTSPPTAKFIFAPRIPKSMFTGTERKISTWEETRFVFSLRNLLLPITLRA